jgi:hypothetical protein
LGNNVNLGAGTRLANLPVMSMKDPITHERPNLFIDIDGNKIDTGLSKLGAILGDSVQTGCNVVTNPGCIVGKNTLIYPLAALQKGYYHPNCIVKLRQQLEIVERI